jgi:hypothetical protein
MRFIKRHLDLHLFSKPYQRPESGDGEREASMARQVPYEPPACIRFVRRLGLIA